MEKKKNTKKLIAIRIRGSQEVDSVIKDTLKMLNLHKKNWAVILDDEPGVVGMLMKAKDYLTWGTISEEKIKELYEKRGEETKNKRFVEYNKKRYKKYFRLHPPKGGFERKGIKTPFSKQGALGNRGKEAEELLSKMMI